MNQLETLLSWLTLLFEVALCGFIFVNKVQRALPFFSVYAFVLLANTLAVWIIYKTFGFDSQAAYACYWASVILNALVRSFAIAELCRYKLRGYRGIWALVWRLLACIAGLCFLHAAFDAWGQPNRLAIYSLTFDRDFGIAAVVILTALLLIHNYYGLSLETSQKTIATGMCLVCGMDLFADTVLRSLYAGYLYPFLSADRTARWFALRENFLRITDVWSTIHLFTFMVAMGIWCYALRKPLPGRLVDPALLPSRVYEEFSPAINLRLNAFNERLTELLKS